MALDTSSTQNGPGRSKVADLWGRKKALWYFCKMSVFDGIPQHEMRDYDKVREDFLMGFFFPTNYLNNDYVWDKIEVWVEKQFGAVYFLLEWIVEGQLTHHSPAGSHSCAAWREQATEDCKTQIVFPGWICRKWCRKWFTSATRYCPACQKAQKQEEKGGI